MQLSAIDVGMTNLGLAVIEVTQDWKWSKVLRLERISLNRLLHKHVKRAQCTLHHTKEASDYVDHFHQEYGHLFADSKFILIERQPPEGMKHIEQLLFRQYRDKAQLVHPRTLHKFLKMQHLDYEQRKKRAVELARKQLQEIDSKYVMDDKTERQHDIADAVNFLAWFVSKKRTEYIKSRKRARTLETIPIDLDDYAFLPQEKKVKSRSLASFMGGSSVE